ncbi:MAG TPA: hypothetical protein VNA16_01790 [Abditibacteriaceae bacterium]|nr:hypothetical protein [Abditibacteriaceae bacterium]
MPTVEAVQPTTDPLLQKARAIARAVEEQGGRALLVGGYVRDELLGLSPKDADLEVYGVEAVALREMLRRFGRVDCVGESFRVYKLVWHHRAGTGATQRYELDVSLPRRDKKIGAGHRGFEVEGDPQATVEDAARRRDFTINAILSDPLSGELIDPFHGRADLEKRVLRAVDAAHFAEDPLRVLRAIQFAARFEMTIEPATVQLCRSLALDDLPKERVWGEWEKLLLKAARPSLGILAAEELDVLDKRFPYLAQAVRRRGLAIGAALDRAALERAALDYEKQVTLMLAVLGCFLGKPYLEQLLDALGIYTLRRYDVRRQVIVLSGERNRAGQWFARRDEVPDKEFRYLSARCEPRLLYHLTRARGDVAAAEWFLAHMEDLGVADGPPAPLLMGRHLLEMGLQPGPQIGQITQTVYAQQLAGEVTTLDESLAAARVLLAPDRAAESQSQ